MINKDLYFDPKDYEIACLRQTIEKFKAYDRKRKEFYADKMVRLGELESYVEELEEQIKSLEDQMGGVANGTLVGKLRKKNQSLKATNKQLNRYPSSG